MGRRWSYNDVITILWLYNKEEDEYRSSVFQNEHNKRFETECIEEQLIMKYYAQPTSSDTGVYVTSSEILEKIIGGIKKPLSTVKTGRIMNKLGYSTRKSNGFNKYHVCELQYVDIQENRKREVAELDSRLFWFLGGRREAREAIL